MPAVIFAMVRWMAAALVFLLALEPAFAQTQADRAMASALRQSSCQACHGQTGDSNTAAVPRLNGQRVDYLRNRLESFRYPIRESPRMIHIMGHLSSRLTAGVNMALAQFYAMQPPRFPGGDANAQGARIYRNGAGNIPACRGCHGKGGEGRGGIPRLAGQHKEYLSLQLHAFGTAARIADPMTHHVWAISPDQAGAIAAYLGDD